MASTPSLRLRRRRPEPPPTRRWPKADWARARPGVDLGDVSADIADLPDLQIGHNEGKHITIDATAAGFGWDATYPGEQASRMDLLTAVRHEIGHALGLEHSADGLMAETLAPGETHGVPPAPAAPPAPPVAPPAPPAAADPPGETPADPPADPASPPADPANPPADPGTAPDPAA